jgi:site-specific DNA recombinase
MWQSSLECAGSYGRIGPPRGNADTAIRAAIYARYSTDQQREASIEDQARNCRRIAEREGWRLGIRYQDQAVSGSRVDRVGSQSMLADAKAGQFDVLVVDDISRLSRATSRARGRA